MKTGIQMKCGMHEARPTIGPSFIVGITVTLSLSSTPTMPKIRTSRTRQPPEGFEDIEGVGIYHALSPFLSN